MSSALTVAGFEVRLGDLHIVKGVDLDVPYGEIHALMGPNGSGKSTLCHALMGKAEYTASGRAEVGGLDITGLPVQERARAGLFQSFQYPVEIGGVTLRDLLDEMAGASGDEPGFAARLDTAIAKLGMGPFIDRPVNQGLSGGEKKRSELFQLTMLQPRAALLDEIDSGLDIDAVREVAAAVEAMRSPDLGVLIITHYSRILRYLPVDRVHVMMGGRIVRSGGAELAGELESKGYDGVRAEWGLPAPNAVEEPRDPFLSL